MPIYLPEDEDKQIARETSLRMHGLDELHKVYVRNIILTNMITYIGGLVTGILIMWVL